MNHPLGDILRVKFDSKLSFEDPVHGIVFRETGLEVLVKSLFVGTSMLLRYYYAFVLPILEYCSPVWGSAAECHLQLPERQVYSVAQLCPDQTFSSFCHIAKLCRLYKVNFNSNLRFVHELPSSSIRVRHTRAAAAAHSLEFEV